MSRGAILRVALMLFVALLLVLRASCGGSPMAPQRSERGPAGVSSGADGEERAAALGPEPAPARLTAIAGTVTDQDGRVSALAGLRGTAFVASLIYTRCPSVCPRVVAEMKRLERELPATELPHYVLFSLDPEHDTPEVLRAFAAAHALERVRWRLLAPDTSALRGLAAALGVAWSPAAGGFAHSAVIAVVDSAGVVRHRRLGLETDDGKLAAAWRTFGAAGRRASD